MPEPDDEPQKPETAEAGNSDEVAAEMPTDEQPSEPEPGAQAEHASGELGDAEQVMADGQAPKPAGKSKRFFAGFWRRKKWTLPLMLLVVIAVIFAVPATRYPLLAVKMKRSFSVEIMDGKTDAPVSGALVTLDGKTAMTDSAGKASLNAKVGKRTLEISKKYYQSSSENVFVGVGSSHNSSKIGLQATGRQVPIKVVNKITGKAVVNAEVKVLDTEAKTGADGMATIVLPTGSPTQSTEVTASGYNDSSAKIQVTSQVVTANTFRVTPSGRVYFLSNLSGNIDVVSTNLDGSSRQAVLAGTGNEDPSDTVLLAARDWKYLALLSKRGGGQYASLYLINTSTNQFTTMDEGSATFTPVGWSGHRFIYEATRENVQDWRPGKYALKSFNADTGKITLLDQTTASGTSESNYIAQNFGYGTDTYMVGNTVVYIKQWSAGYLEPDSALHGKQDQILNVAPDGTSKQVLKNIAVPTTNGSGVLQSVVYQPNKIYFKFANGAVNVYYEYANGYVTQSNTVTDSTFSQAQQNYSTYLLSPSGSQTFWSEPRDGKNTLFVGDANGSSAKQIASLSDYSSYGWYTDNYLLVEKGGSELYIMPPSGGTALKISDYYKPPQNFNGYGGL